ncbi:gag-pol polyprotein [Lasius niger]|uniref:Gag-pol polyprotein n=1 Tax=Lasius niger TaxID=67767 RepID=A0A0J7KPI2_LASNI|nr:gag-pol polyprotein [Lasius niger]
MLISQIDIATAYLNGMIDILVYMEKPEMLQEMLERIVATEQETDLTEKARKMLSLLNGGDKVCRLNKAIYSLRQAGRQWHERLDKALKKLGLTPTNADPCVYYDKGKLTLLLVYVDDILIAYRDEANIRRLEEELAKNFVIRDRTHQVLSGDRSISKQKGDTSLTSRIHS